MYRLALLSCAVAPVGNSPLTTTPIDPDQNRAWGVDHAPELRGLPMTILDPISGNLVSIDTSSPPRP
jgi:hypothetical protein